jgi:hypothetical protein
VRGQVPGLEPARAWCDAERNVPLFLVRASAPPTVTQNRAEAASDMPIDSSGCTQLDDAFHALIEEALRHESNKPRCGQHYFLCLLLTHQPGRQ